MCALQSLKLLLLGPENSLSHKGQMQSLLDLCIGSHLVCDGAGSDLVCDLASSELVCDLAGPMGVWPGTGSSAEISMFKKSNLSTQTLALRRIIYLGNFIAVQKYSSRIQKIADKNTF